MAQCLLCKQGGLSLNPQHLRISKSQAWLFMTATPVLGFFAGSQTKVLEDLVSVNTQDLAHRWLSDKLYK